MNKSITDVYIFPSIWLLQGSQFLYGSFKGSRHYDVVFGPCPVWLKSSHSVRPLTNPDVPRVGIQGGWRSSWDRDWRGSTCCPENGDPAANSVLDLLSAKQGKCLTQHQASPRFCQTTPAQTAEVTRGAKGRDGRRELCASICTTLLEEPSLRAAPALLLLSSLFSFCDIKALLCRRCRLSVMKQRASDSLQWLCNRFTFAAKDRELERWEHPIERQGFQNSQETFRNAGSGWAVGELKPLLIALMVRQQSQCFLVKELPSSVSCAIPHMQIAKSVQQQEPFYDILPQHLAPRGPGEGQDSLLATAMLEECRSQQVQPCLAIPATEQSQTPNPSNAIWRGFSFESRADSHLSALPVIISLYRSISRTQLLAYHKENRLSPKHPGPVWHLDSTKGKLIIVITTEPNPSQHSTEHIHDLENPSVPYNTVQALVLTVLSSKLSPHVNANTSFLYEGFESPSGATAPMDKHPEAEAQAEGKMPWSPLRAVGRSSGGAMEPQQGTGSTERKG
ncbi:hypothetical protein Anapl_12067 [Anas platyrhynchos]|uniref:Uncharacterized protein n=1 Tax=Anas platyrhynchos TaxID=8839 RepID=R0L5U7_ANAPL|nr:hypothetical protein Anapl_12067 [Anas platyrhynchos]